mmetsp:Transcript_3701/g.9811  ORF Transcript_3701/g.9811 Transcript_3701/m.9811 type:complete len:94 (-) Transcript_3701:223-504(-)
MRDERQCSTTTTPIMTSEQPIRSVGTCEGGRLTTLGERDRMALPPRWFSTRWALSILIQFPIRGVDSRGIYWQPRYSAFNFDGRRRHETCIQC